MITPEMIPKEVVEAIQICTGMSDAAARGLAIIMLEQWPQMEEHITWPEEKLSHIILPMEAGDE